MEPLSKIIDGEIKVSIALNNQGSVTFIISRI